MRTTATNNLLKELTGKEAFQLVMNSYMEVVQRKEPTFSDTELDKVIAGLSNRPNERRAYYQWGNAVDVIHTIHYEIRLAAMEAVWRLSAVTAYMANMVKSSLTDKENDGRLLETLPEIESTSKYLESLIVRVVEQHIMLDAFSAVLDVDIAVMTQHETELLSYHIALYNKMIERINAEIWYNAHPSKEYREEEVTYLAALPKPTEGADLEKKQMFMEKIEKAKDASFWEVLEGCGL